MTVRAGLLLAGAPLLVAAVPGEDDGALNYWFYVVPIVLIAAVLLMAFARRSERGERKHRRDGSADWSSDDGSDGGGDGGGD